MNLKPIAESIKSYVGVKRKTPIVEVTRRMKSTISAAIPFGAKVIESFGEDCAVIDIGYKDNYLLFKAEEIWDRLIDADPTFAGYCSVLVSVNDITAKGGTPIAMVNTLAATSSDIRNKIVEGITEGCSKFNVPMVGGHLSPEASANRLSVSIIGMVRKKSLIRSNTAQPDDLIIAAVDLDGRFHKAFKTAWDTTTHKSKAEVEDRLRAMREIAKDNLATAAKDISNPGIVGTLGMLLDSSNLGGEIDLTNIPKPPGVDMDQWLKAYPGFGVILTSDPKKADQCVSILSKHGVVSKLIGKVVNSRKLLISDGESSVEVFDFNIDKLSGKPSD
ncbi:MAG: methanogenesis marker 2 protein [Candidatus Atabeyarchaeum deiterrae]